MAVRVVECLGPEHGAEDSEQAPGPPIDPGSRSLRSLGRDDNLSEPRVTKEEAVTATPPIPIRWSPETSTSLTQAWPAARSAFLSFRSARGSQRKSEEHTSELQSLQRISYHAFCLNKKKHKSI